MLHVCGRAHLLTDELQGAVSGALITHKINGERGSGACGAREMIQYWGKVKPLIQNKIIT